MNCFAAVLTETDGSSAGVKPDDVSCDMPVHVSGARVWSEISLKRAECTVRR